jgi:hypothetical protein
MSTSSLYTILQSFAVLDISHTYRTAVTSIIDNSEIDDFLLEEGIRSYIQEYQPKRKHIISNKGINSIMDIMYNITEMGYMECPITMVNFKEGETISLLPCGHYFNKESIMRWVSGESATCPLCRSELLCDIVIE